MLKSSKNLLYSPYEKICDIIGADNFFSTADSTRSKKNERRKKLPQKSSGMFVEVFFLLAIEKQIKL